MRKSLVFTGALLCLGLSLAACKKEEAPPAAEAAAATHSIAAPDAGVTVEDAAPAIVGPPPVDLLAFSAGTQIVAKPEFNQGIFMMPYDPINLFDESPSSDWSASFKPTAVVVFEFPEQTEVERLVFDTAGLNRDEKGPKSVTVEISDTSKDAGFQVILKTDLVMAKNGQDFPVTAKLPGHWLRLTINSNYGDEYVGMTGLHAYGKQLTHDAKLEGLSGTYNGWSGWGKVQLKQEGTRVTGCYEYQDGVMSGGIEGRVLKTEMIETDSTGDKSRQTGLFTFSPDGKKIFGLTRKVGAAPGDGFSSFYSGEKINDDIGDCPSILGWKGNAAQSQLGNEIESTGRARLDGINFDFASAKLRAESAPLLKQVAGMLNEHLDWKLTLEGHTDNVGGATYNQTLSAQRAAAVVSDLVAQGVDAGRLKSVGFGMDKPVASNDSDGGRSQNRRVEIVKE